MKRIRLLLVTTAFFVSTSVLASTIPTGWYLEGSAGMSQLYNINYGTNTTLDKNKGVAWSIAGGYKFIPFLGIEVGYTHYANAIIEFNNTHIANNDHYAIDIASRWILPLYVSNFELFGKIGAARLVANGSITNASVISANNLTVKSGSRGVTSWYYGLGGDYALTPSWTVQIQWTRAQGNSSTGTLNFYSMGFAYLFG